jgi:hypothetical protein
VLPQDTYLCSKVPKRKGCIRSVIEYQLRVIRSGPLSGCKDGEASCHIVAMNLTDIRV